MEKYLRASVFVKISKLSICFYYGRLYANPYFVSCLANNRACRCIHKKDTAFMLTHL